MPQRRATAVDLAGAIVLAVLGQLEVWAPSWVPGVGDATGNHVLLSVTAAAATLPLVARRRLPLGVLVVVVGALALQRVVTTPTDGLALLAALMLAAYSASAYSTTTR